MPSSCIDDTGKKLKKPGRPAPKAPIKMKTAKKRPSAAGGKQISKKPAGALKKKPACAKPDGGDDGDEDADEAITEG